MTLTPEPNGAPNDAPDNAQGHIEDSLASVREALTGLRFGTVVLTVHEGRLVQIDVTEKKRLKPT